MSDYRPPVDEMLFILDSVAGMDAIAALPGCEMLTGELARSVMEEAGELASNVLAPINAQGDGAGADIRDGQVHVPESFRQAYQAFAEGGWGGISAPEAHGGQGLPQVVSMPVQEMWQSANLAWSLCPLLSQGAQHALELYASEDLRRQFLPKLVSGEWTGTMNLTEPQAGSDLGLVRCQAKPENGHYLINGQKIFITFGDHDMAGNILHLVLARLPDAPEGTRGLSLFLVPKRIPDADGAPGSANNVRAVSVEHKLGLHGSPTCVMSYEDAVGYLVGEENQGLPHMFAMMNDARLSVGLQGVAIAERAYQQALDFAANRMQGKAPGSRETVPILRHPDVRRMLMEMKSQIFAMRALTYMAAMHTDFARRHPDDGQRACHQRRLDLLTPIIKGWNCERAVELTSLGIQIHGGMGYVEETGAAQHYRDARITTIYEGTSGIQAGDLVGRKIIRDQGAALRELLSDMRETLDQMGALAGEDQVVAAALEEGIEQAASVVEWFFAELGAQQDLPGAAAFNLMMMLGYLCGGWLHARAALAVAGGGDARAAEARRVCARFYAEHFMPQVGALARRIRSGAASTMALSAEQF
ncbi:MAG: acyl-CoA dehydrogenase [Gammaproteobacteria bacterium]|nr:acyl-CoA dehydrogenase [Gammaproteobacteria bacterium]